MYKKIFNMFVNSTRNVGLVVERVVIVQKIFNIHQIQQEMLKIKQKMLIFIKNIKINEKKRKLYKKC